MPAWPATDAAVVSRLPCLQQRTRMLHALVRLVLPPWSCASCSTPELLWPVLKLSVSTELLACSAKTEGQARAPSCGNSERPRVAGSSSQPELWRLSTRVLDLQTPLASLSFENASRSGPSQRTLTNLRYLEKEWHLRLCSECGKLCSTTTPNCYRCVCGAAWLSMEVPRGVVPADTTGCLTRPTKRHQERTLPNLVGANAIRTAAAPHCCKACPSCCVAAR